MVDHILPQSQMCGSFVSLCEENTPTAKTVSFVAYFEEAFPNRVQLPRRHGISIKTEPLVGDEALELRKSTGELYITR